MSGLYACRKLWLLYTVLNTTDGAILHLSRIYTASAGSCTLQLRVKFHLAASLIPAGTSLTSSKCHASRTVP